MAAVPVRIRLPVAEVGTCKGAWSVINKESDLEQIVKWEEQRIKLLTNLRVGVERLDMHDVADSSSDNDQLPAVGFANACNSTQAPVSEICVAFRSSRAQPHLLRLSTNSSNSNCSFDIITLSQGMINHSSRKKQ